MNVNRQPLFRCLLILWVLQAAAALHMLPRMIERFHNASPDEAKRISKALTHRVNRTGFFRQRVKQGYKVKVSHNQASHKISASLLKLKPIPENPRVLRQEGLIDPETALSPVKLSEKAFPHHHLTLIDKQVESESARKKLIETERNLILAKAPNEDPNRIASFETTEIRDALNFVEFKMEEINSLMTECINQGFKNNVRATADQIKNECVGASYQILFYNYREALSKVKDILLELLKIKLATLREDFEDETNFFIDMIENLIDKDYSIIGSIEIAKKSARYYVTPRYFETLMDLASPEINAFTEIHDRLKKSRKDIQILLDRKAKEDLAYMANLRAQIDERKLGQSTSDNKRAVPSRFLKSIPSQSAALESVPLENRHSESNNETNSLTDYQERDRSVHLADTRVESSSLAKSAENGDLV